MQLICSGLILPRASAAWARMRRMSVKVTPPMAPKPSWRKSRRATPAQLVLKRLMGAAITTPDAPLLLRGMKSPAWLEAMPGRFWGVVMGREKLLGGVSLGLFAVLRLFSALALGHLLFVNGLELLGGHAAVLVGIGFFEGLLGGGGR